MSGWALFGLGVWLHVYRESFLYAALFKDNPTSPMIVTDRVSLLMIGVGGFVVTVCFLGCCGACTDSVCFLAFVSIYLIVCSVAEQDVNITEVHKPKQFSYCLISHQVDVVPIRLRHKETQKMTSPSH